MTFPLFHRPGTVVFLDDDPDYLEMLALVLPRQWHLRLFMRPPEAVPIMSARSPPVPLNTEKVPPELSPPASVRVVSCPRAS